MNCKSYTVPWICFRYVKDPHNELAATGEMKVQHQSEEISKYDNLESSSQLHIAVKSSLFKANSLFQILEELGNIFTLNK